MKTKKSERKTNTASKILLEIQQAQKRMEDWWLIGSEVHSLYRGDGDQEHPGSRKYKILWQITETQRPAIYLHPPDPEIRRRYLEDKPVEREAAEVVEKTVEVAMQCPGNEFDPVMRSVVSDFLLPGRGVARVKYKAETEDYQDEYDETRTRKTDEKVYIEHVNWKGFLHSDGKVWADVWWEAFLHDMTRDDCVRMFGEEKGSEIPLVGDFTEDDRNRWKHTESKTSIARVWEFWNKRDKKVYYVAEGYPKLLRPAKKDPLNLQGFFPTPEPLYMISTPSTLEPVPEYKQYQDQADQLYRLTARITDLIEWAKVNGWFDSAFAEQVSSVIEAPEGCLRAVDGFDNWKEAGGGKGAIDFWPIETFVNALTVLVQEKARVKQEIYEIVGISDIMRGVTKARVTKVGQEQEAEFSTGDASRTGEKRGKVERYARDLIALMAEIVADQFEASTMIKMTGVKQAKDVQGGMDAVIKLLRTEQLRNYRITVQTRSTIAANEAQQKRDLNEFMGAFSKFLQQIFPAVQSGVIPQQVAHTMMKAFIRRFELGRDMEDILDEVGKNPPPPKKDPKAENDKAKLQIEQQRLQLDQQKMQMEAKIEAAKLQLKRQELMQKGEIEEAKLINEQIIGLLNFQTVLANRKDDDSE
jgi:hypothetical protein